MIQPRLHNDRASLGLELGVEPAIRMGEARLDPSERRRAPELARRAALTGSAA